MAPDSAMQFLQAWYASQCDGDWEHGEGVRIATLDNPGWELMVDLIGTALEGKNLEYRLTERSGDDWLAIKADGSQFYAATGPQNLSDALDAFQAFVENDLR